LNKKRRRRLKKRSTTIISFIKVILFVVVPIIGILIWDDIPYGIPRLIIGALILILILYFIIWKTLLTLLTIGEPTQLEENSKALSECRTNVEKCKKALAELKSEGEPYPIEHPGWATDPIRIKKERLESELNIAEIICEGLSKELQVIENKDYITEELIIDEKGNERWVEDKYVHLFKKTNENKSPQSEKVNNQFNISNITTTSTHYPWNKPYNPYENELTRELQKKKVQHEEWIRNWYRERGIDPNKFK